MSDLGTNLSSQAFRSHATLPHSWAGQLGVGLAEIGRFQSPGPGNRVVQKKEKVQFDRAA